MIAVLGRWPRSGTSLLMSMLAVGGLDPIRDDHDGPVTGAHPVGAYQHAGVLLGDAAGTLAATAHDRSCVKVFPRHIIDLAAVGVYPAKVLMTVRDWAESDASWVRAWPHRTRQGDPRVHEVDVERALDLLAVADVPVLPVDFHRLIDDPGPVAVEIAGFLGVPLDVAAMAAVPSAEHRHFGGPAV